MIEDSGLIENPNVIKPFRGEVVDYPGTGRVVVIIGYHSLERKWGQIVKEHFHQNVIDRGGKILFYEIQNSPIETGEESPVVDAQVSRFLKEAGNVEMVIDIHEHPEAKATRVRNQWSLTTENGDVASEARSRIRDLRVLPFDDYSRRKTAGQNIPYAITDPDLPSGGIDAYVKGQITPQVQKAINDTLSFVVNLSNIQLKVSS